jgi:hypothetical protein
MPGYTSPKAIPYPLPTEPPNGAGQMLALADKVDDLIVAEETARANGDNNLSARIDGNDADIADIYTKIPTARSKWGSAQQTTDSNGRMVITHSAGWVPSMVVVTPVVPGSTRRMLSLTVDGDSITTSSFALWVWDDETDRFANAQVVRVQWIIRD